MSIVNTQDNSSSFLASVDDWTKWLTGTYVNIKNIFSGSGTGSGTSSGGAGSNVSNSDPSYMPSFPSWILPAGIGLIIVYLVTK